MAYANPKPIVFPELAINAGVADQRVFSQNKAFTVEDFYATIGTVAVTGAGTGAQMTLDQQPKGGARTTRATVVMANLTAYAVGEVIPSTITPGSVTAPVDVAAGDALIIKNTVQALAGGGADTGTWTPVLVISLSGT